MTLPHPPSAADRPVTGRGKVPGPNAAALLLIVAGGALLTLAYTVANWFRGSQDASMAVAESSTFSDVHRRLAQIDEKAQDLVDVAPLAKAYFSWLAWALLVVVLVAALIAVLPGRAARTARTAGAVLALAAVAVTFLALKLTSIRDATYAAFEVSYGEYLSHAQLGFWLAVAGYALAGAGALAGPPRPPREPRL